MPKDDYIPQQDEDFENWQKDFMTPIAANPAKYGVTAADVTAAQAAQTTWEAAFPGHITARAAALAACTAKDDARSKYEPILRGLGHKVHGTPGMTNALRASVGLPEKGLPRTPIDAPKTKPIARIEQSGHNTLTINFMDETTPMKRAKPEGVQGCQLWFFVGTAAPTDPSGYAFLALDTATPYVHVHATANIGKTAYYLLRWQNAKGEAGPWSDVFSAVIPT